MYSSERHFQREGSASLVPLSHTLKKKRVEDVMRMRFTVNSSQSSPIRLILSASVKQTAERGPEIKR